MKIKVTDGRFATCIHAAGLHYLTRVALGSMEYPVDPETELSLSAGRSNVITIPRPRDVTLRLERSDGHPLSGATVHVDRGNASGTWFTEGHHVYPPVAVRRLPAAPSGLEPGSYVIRDVFQTCRVWAYASGCAWTAVTVRNARGGGATKATLPPGGTLLFSVPTYAARQDRELIDAFGGTTTTYPLPDRAKHVTMEGLVAGRHAFTWIFKHLNDAATDSDIIISKEVHISPLAPAMLLLEPPVPDQDGAKAAPEGSDDAQR
ncbi:MAG: hypothetical protein AB7U23_11240 [Dehalococcoidia bacterium]